MSKKKTKSKPISSKNKPIRRHVKSLGEKPPVITVMGHIDHGKTTLLDALRQSEVQVNESGGITQHIGAYQITHKNRKLTFIDTPGHAAFANMRSRGVQATDLVILVIDAVESVKPQTKECIDHIKKAQVPFLVAINKMDLPNAVPEIVKKDLADVGVAVEGYGGDIVAVPVSAKTKKGLDQLLEMLLLLADIQELKADPKANLSAIIIESSLDQKKGPVATVIVKNGTLKIGDEIQTGKIVGKIKALFNENNQALKSVKPGEPAQILGFKQVPKTGSQVTNTKDKAFKKDSKKTAYSKPSKEKSDLNINNTDNQSLKIILKADVAGTLEAIIQNLGNEISLVSSGVGNVNESDILLAQSTNAKIIAFRVNIINSAKKLADIEAVLIKNYSLIHELLDDLQQEILKMLEPTIDEQEIGVAKIIAEFTVKGNRIAGCQINSGKITVNDLIHLTRGKDQIADSKIKSIHQNKESIQVAKKPQECGLLFTTDMDFKLKDKIIAYKKI